ncbi:YdcH family protein [Aestuariispira ectoiniformans]|uniref:YdcH family protein n=1 Tax=Aestuariispira ectoiniformans TaxID=2775080 RepID=UPI00223AEEA3
MDEQEEQALRHRIEELRIEHKDLDDVIARITEEPPFNHLQVQRLKKKKLSIKDEILRLESQLIPDIIA